MSQTAPDIPAFATGKMRSRQTFRRSSGSDNLPCVMKLVLLALFLAPAAVAGKGHAGRRPASAHHTSISRHEINFEGSLSIALDKPRRRARGGEGGGGLRRTA